MAANLDTTKGRVAFAFTGPREAIWHREGQQMQDGASIAEWAEGSGLDFTIKSATVEYQGEGDIQLRKVDGKVVLYRDDTLSPLGVVSSRYKIVNPIEQFQFFAEFCKLVDAKMSTAGSLFGGQQFFASAQFGSDIRIAGTDILRPMVGFHTSNDGSFASTIRNVMTRYVCDNTVTAGLAEAAMGLITCSHRSAFDPISTAQTMAKWVQSQLAIAEKFRMLSQTPVRMPTAEAMVFDLLNNTRPEAKRQDADATVITGHNVRNSAGYKKILSLFAGEGRGAELPGVRGTAWGLFNAVTEYADHHARAKTESHRFESSQFGAGAKLKGSILERLTAFATAD